MTIKIAQKGLCKLKDYLRELIYSFWSAMKSKLQQLTDFRLLLLLKLNKRTQEQMQ